MNIPNFTEIAQLVTAAAAVGAFIVSWRANSASRKNGKKIEQVHISINSRMDQLLSARGDASMAAGVVQGRNEILHPIDKENQ
jgi:hypothetical protein